MAENVSVIFLKENISAKRKIDVAYENKSFSFISIPTLTTIAWFNT